MSSEFDSAEEPKDRTKWIWTGVVVTLIVMVLVLWRWGRMNPQASVVRARHILITFSGQDAGDRARAMTLAKELRERILAGEDFGELAREYSNDPWSSYRGGDLGYSPQGTYEDAFESYIWMAPVGQVSDIIMTSKGFHIVEVVYRHFSAVDAHRIELVHQAVQEIQKRDTHPDTAPQ